MVDLGRHPRITLLTYAEVQRVSGFIGNFEVEIRQKARKVDHSLCIGCGTCWDKCPEKVPSEFDLGLGTRTAIYVPFAQAVPLKPVIDTEHCRYIKFLQWQDKQEGKKPPQCLICEKLCPTQAIDWEQEDQILTENFGAIVVATGFDTFDPSVYGEYGGGRYPDVITCLQLERLLNASGPTGGEVLRPSDKKHAKTVVFVSCVGSRDERVGQPYCSKACCMYIAKEAIMLKEHDPEVQSYVFYMDIRAGGKDYEEFVRRAQEEAGVLYLRGRVSKIYPNDGKLIVRGEDSLIGRPVEIAADLVVLATGMVPSKGAAELAQTLNISHNIHNFMTEAHVKLRPVETQTDGIFLAGAASGPRDIPESVAQGSAAAAKALGLFSKNEITIEPLVAYVSEESCSGCGICQLVCPYSAIKVDPVAGVATVNQTLCKGCGTCSAVCSAGAVQLKGFRKEQILSMVEAALK